MAWPGAGAVERVQRSTRQPDLPGDSGDEKAEGAGTVSLLGWETLRGAGSGGKFGFPKGEMLVAPRAASPAIPITDHRSLNSRPGQPAQLPTAPGPEACPLPVWWGVAPSGPLYKMPAPVGLRPVPPGHRPSGRRRMARHGAQERVSLATRSPQGRGCRLRCRAEGETASPGHQICPVGGGGGTLVIWRKGWGPTSWPFSRTGCNGEAVWERSGLRRVSYLQGPGR